MKKIFFVMLLLMTTGSSFSESKDFIELKESIINLHLSENGKNVIWFECGERVKDPDKRASEYAVAVMESIQDVYKKTGFKVDYRVVSSILYRESSNDECVIGRQEIDKLKKQLGKIPSKSEILNYVKAWPIAHKEAEAKCNGKDYECSKKYISNKYPQYVGIRGWDIGVAQYRWPGVDLSRKVNSVSFAKKNDDVVDKLMDYKVGIQILVEDLAVYHEQCKSHEHWLLNKRGEKVRKLTTDEAYYVHHHTGPYSWSLDYWKRIQKHLNTIEQMKSISSIQ